MTRQQGQSTVEYILVVTAVIAVVILFTTNKDTGFQKQLTNVLNQTTGSMEQVANRFSGNR